MPRILKVKLGLQEKLSTIHAHTTSTVLNEMWRGVPASAVVRIGAPCRLTEDDMLANYAYRGQGVQDPIDLLYRVCEGVKPMATILMRCPKRRHAARFCVLSATQRVGLGCQIFYARTGRQEAVVFQPRATLADYYDPDAVIAQYAAAGLSLPRDLFEAPVMHYARGLANEQFPRDVRLPLIGLCFGYPIRETIDMVHALQAIPTEPKV